MQDKIRPATEDGSKLHRSRQIAALQQYYCTISVTVHEYFINQSFEPSVWHLVYIILPSPES